jgi:hypothetical protein
MASESLIVDHQVSEFAKCALDPYYFITEHCTFFDPQHGGVVKVHRLPHQNTLIKIIIAKKWVIILKPRQVGVTWTISGLLLHDTIFVPGANDLIFSRTDKEAAKTLRERCRYMWMNLPPFLHLPAKTDNSEMLQFVIDDARGVYSYIRSFASTPGSGVGETATRVVMDEWSKIHPDIYAEQVYTDVAPTVSTGSLIMMSTAEGKNKFFARTLFDAMAGTNDFTPIFIPYRQGLMPHWDAAWEAQQRRRYPGYLFNQNYPASIADAFLMAGTCMFSVEALKSTLALAPVLHLGDSEIYETYDPDHDYYAGVDTALGSAGRDFSTCQVICATCGRQAARLHTRRHIEQFSEEAYKLLRYFGHPFVTPESQPLGPLFVKILKDNRYPMHRVYARSAAQYCWHTTEANRKEILGELEAAIRTGAMRLVCQETIDEFLGFGYNEEKNKFEGLAGHDDEVMAMALAYHACANAAPAFESSGPKSYLITESDYETILEINWSKKDPFRGREAITCPKCEGKKVIPNPWTLNIDVCTLCHGVGRVTRRLA